MTASVPTEGLRYEIQAAIESSAFEIGLPRVCRLRTALSLRPILPQCPRTGSLVSIRLWHVGSRRSNRVQQSFDTLVLADDQRPITVKLSCEQARVQTE
jgi:hypothetical protein